MANHMIWFEVRRPCSGYDLTVPNLNAVRRTFKVLEVSSIVLYGRKIF